MRRLGIGEKGKQQTLHKGVHLSGNRAEIDGRAQNEGIGLLNPLQDGRQIILDGTPAIAFAAFGFAFETTDATFKIEVIQMDEFGFGALGGGSLQGIFQQGGGIPGSSWGCR